MDTDTPAAERDIMTWEDLDRLVAQLAERLSRGFDVLLAITRGGLVSAGMLAYRLRIRNILVAAVEFCDDQGQPGPHPTAFSSRPIRSCAGRAHLAARHLYFSGHHGSLETRQTKQLAPKTC